MMVSFDKNVSTSFFKVSCLKAEQAQLTRSLEKERQRASENRQEYLVATEAAATHEGRVKQLEEEIKEIRSRFKRELAEERTMRELLQQVKWIFS